MTVTPRTFVETWGRSELRENQGAQSHFNMLCELVGHKTPAELDPEGKFFTFEEHVEKATGGKGRADVWYKGHFAWEYKGKHKDLDTAYQQLLAYRGGLDNPPLLVVCDFIEYRIYPQWPDISGQPFKFYNKDLEQPETRKYITWLLENPIKFFEQRQSELEQRAQITRELAEEFAKLADLMRQYKVDGKVDGKPVWNSMQIARFLTKLTFVLFAEDIDLLPRIGNMKVSQLLLDGAKNAPHEFMPQLSNLFKAMNGDTSTFVMQPVPYFNGGIFADSAPGANDGTEVLDLTQLAYAGTLEMLRKVSDADWRYVNPTIFGTLFEGALEPGKRAQLGAHYTSEADIRLIIEPVLMQPLYRQWEATRQEAEPLLQTYLAADSSPRSKADAKNRLDTLYNDMMDALGSVKVLDPACGSGNFLYVSLRALKDLEGRVRNTFAPMGEHVINRDVVTPRQLYGIEKDEFAANLAHIVVWIGYLQWRYEDEGKLYAQTKTSRPHPRQLPDPIIQDKSNKDEPNHILCDDAIMRYDAEGKPYEPEWPAVDVIVSNPPFLGGNRIRQELGNNNIDNIFKLYADRIPAFSDLVCYWFEKARAHIEKGYAKRAGLLATNSIRGGGNRTVLERIKETGNIFMAWSDRSWLLQGAAVRVSMVGFDAGIEQTRVLDGIPAINIHADLTSEVDVTTAKRLKENNNLSFIGPQKDGPLDITASEAQKMLRTLNKSGRLNSEVIRPYMNGIDIVRNTRSSWIIDFTLLSLEEASQYEAPFDHVVRNVKPLREKNRDLQRRTNWWKMGRSGSDYRNAVGNLKRQILTSLTAKHRIFIWQSIDVMPANTTVAIARDDDYFFGILHSFPHELWSLRLGNWLGKGNDPRYTPTTTFETFPFPWKPGSEPTTDPFYIAISDAARCLNEEREAWLNPPELVNKPSAGAIDSAAKALRERTLTNLYNALENHRTGQVTNRGVPESARKFAPKLAELHDALDRAVLAAYGWDDLAGRLRTAEGDEEMLRRLLQLNGERARV